MQCLIDVNILLPSIVFALLPKVSMRGPKRRSRLTNKNYVENINIDLEIDIWKDYGYLRSDNLKV
jgi:hypothetical protein